MAKGGYCERAGGSSLFAVCCLLIAVRYRLSRIAASSSSLRCSSDFFLTLLVITLRNASRY